MYKKPTPQDFLSVFAVLCVNHAFKDQFCLAGERDAMCRYAHDEIAAAHLDRNVLVRGAKPEPDGRGDRRTRACAAGRRLPVAALVDPHLQHIAVDHADKLGVDALGEDRRVLKLRAERFKVERVNAVVEDDAVRVADREAGDGVGFAADRERLFGSPL